jgi:hypothetical protein
MGVLSGECNEDTFKLLPICCENRFIICMVTSVRN